MVLSLKMFYLTLQNCLSMINQQNKTIDNNTLIYRNAILHLLNFKLIHYVCINV